MIGVASGLGLSAPQCNGRCQANSASSCTLVVLYLSMVLQGYRCIKCSILGTKPTTLVFWGRRSDT